MVLIAPLLSEVPAISLLHTGSEIKEVISPAIPGLPIACLSLVLDSHKYKHRPINKRTKNPRTPPTAAPTVIADRVARDVMGLVA
jgi:type III secretory pathway lipoprotein EscJ